MLNRTCYLLSYIKFGDQDAILHCYSSEEGFESFIVKGIYTSRNKKKPYLLPLNLLNLSLRKTAGSGINFSVTKMELAANSYLNATVKNTSVVFFAAEFLHQILKEENQSHKAFQEISLFRKEIDASNFNSSAGLLFNFLKIIGVAPLFSERRYLDPVRGNFTNEISPIVFDEGISLVWKKYLNSENGYLINLSKEERNRFLDSLLKYYEYHFSGFSIPQSLGVLRQIF